jgi:microcystin-dependent protein
MSDAFIGEIRLFPYTRSEAPEGWLFCDGSSQPINNYQALYAVLGNLYGTSTKTTFVLPNLQGHAPVGTGTGTGLTPRTTGQSLGAETVVLTTAQIPAHTHQLNGAFQNDPTVTVTANPVAGDYFTYPNYNVGIIGWYSNNYDAGTPATTLSTSALSTTGSSQAHENRQPFLVLRWLINWNGVYPTHD